MLHCVVPSLTMAAASRQTSVLSVDFSTLLSVLSRFAGLCSAVGSIVSIGRTEDEVEVAAAVEDGGETEEEFPIFTLFLQRSDFRSDCFESQAFSFVRVCAHTFVDTGT